MPIISAYNLSCRRGRFDLFHPISFELNYGQSLLISGSNGVGKTTLLETIAGLRMNDKGKILYKNNDIIENKDDFLSHSFYIGHKPGNKKELNCIENLRSYLHIQGVDISEEQAENALELVGLYGYEYQMAGNLSAGQKKRLALARLNVIDFTIWILDEPFVNLDTSGCDLLLEILHKHLINKGILIITAHDNKEIKSQVSAEIKLKEVNQ